MDHAHMSNPTQEMIAEVGMAGPVLRFRTMPDAIGQNGRELIENRPLRVGPAVYDDASELLAHGLPHESALLEVEIEAFFLLAAP